MLSFCFSENSVSKANNNASVYAFAENTVADAETLKESARRAVGEICEKSLSAGIFYIYGTQNDVSDICMMGINAALVACDYAVTWQGKAGCGCAEEAEKILEKLIDNDIYVTHVFVDCDYVKQGCEKYINDSGNTVELVCLA